MPNRNSSPARIAPSSPQLQNEYIARFQPLTPEERFQVDTLLRNEWILRRLFRAEAQLWEYHALRADRSEGVPLGEALVAGNEVFRRLQRRITLAERSYKDAFAELERLQRARRSLVGVQATGEPDPTPPDQPPADDRTELGSLLPASMESPLPPHSDRPRSRHVGRPGRRRVAHPGESGRGRRARSTLLICPIPSATCNAGRALMAVTSSMARANWKTNRCSSTCIEMASQR